ncbi:SsgA family sporulation/cell division regulator [Streptomyces actuosus]|uniref:SsgA family sporulation/cell division regulator n=1 Tax=Streptomyces actuosus TaxID=1885 RepID=A0ABS2VUW8_STRAS|nr:SsgA family sporulation/cell division regulator [Streptomyces actuosus]MBN0046755.1 SsgA family sporulation/cell division regulator [Streptomyces actuosus]
MCPCLTLNVLLVLSAEEAVSLDVRFAYDADDPLAVQMGFPGAPGHHPPWVFSRDLPAAGLRAPSGDGDVRVRPPCRCHSSDKVRILLHGRRAAAVLYVRAAPLEDWLARTFALVPAGTEGAHLLIEEALARLLGRP